MRNFSILVGIFIFLGVFSLAANQDALEKGKELYERQQFETAIPFLNRAIKETPKKQREAYYFLGMCQLKLGNHGAAEGSFTKALQLQGGSIQALLGRGEAYLGLKNYDSAIADYQKVLELSPDHPEAQYQIGLAYYFKGNYADSASYLKKVLTTRPQDPQLHYYLGWVYYKQKAYDQTILHFETYIKLCPDCPEAEKIKEVLRTLQG